MRMKRIYIDSRLSLARQADTESTVYFIKYERQVADRSGVVGIRVVVLKCLFVPCQLKPGTHRRQSQQSPKPSTKSATILCRFWRL